MGSSLDRPKTSRFEPALDDGALIAAAEELLRSLKPGAPHTVTPAAFNAALAADQQLPPGDRRFAGVPRVPGLRRRLANMPWYELLALLFDSERSTEQVLGARRRREARKVGEEECVVALRTVARRLGAETLRPHEFTRERASIVAVDQRAWRHGRRVEHGFPTAAQVEGVFRTDDEPGWDRALLAAGLAPRSLPSRKGASIVAGMEAFLSDVGCLPWGVFALREYAVARGVALTRLDGAFEDHIERLRADRALLGLWTPAAPPPRGARPAVEVERSRSPEADRVYSWKDLDVLVEGVVRAYELAGERGHRLTQVLHRELARENRGLVPAPSTLDNLAKAHGKTAEWVRAEARRRHSDRQRGKGPERSVLLPAERPARPLPGTGPVPESKPRAFRPRRRSTVSVADLIEAGVLEVGQRLVMARAGLDGEAEVLGDGKLRVDGQVHRSLSAAAVAVSGSKAEQGWDLWALPGEPPVTMAELRQRVSTRAATNTEATDEGRRNVERRREAQRTPMLARWLSGPSSSTRMKTGASPSSTGPASSTR